MATSRAAPRPLLPPDLAQSHRLLQEAMGTSDDIHYLPLRLRWRNTPALVVYLDGLTSTDSLHGDVLEPLRRNLPSREPPGDLADLAAQLLNTGVALVTRDPARVREEVCRGKSALLVDGYSGALILDTQGWEERPVQSPPSETLLKGPRDGFVENVTTNVAMVRRRLGGPGLVVRHFRVGRRGRTRVAVLYIQDLAPRRLVQEIIGRIRSVEYDAVLDSFQLRELLAGPVLSPFPRIEGTERPDKVAAALLSGKVAVIMDTSPFALVAPSTLIDSILAPDDYYSTPLLTLFVRLVRLAGWMVMVLAPPLYIAIEMYNPDIVRTELALYLAQERSGIPLTAAMEVYFLEVVMEMIYEATIRLPAKVSATATVVGGVIVGQAAVQARFISGTALVVAAISAIGSFTLPGPEIGQTWRATKWVLMVAASFFGVYGLFAAGFALTVWLASQDSFGTPYLAPLAPFIFQDLKRDSLWRKPLGEMKGRPRTYRAQDPDRTGRRQNRKYQDQGER
nr:MAG: hypothetical protein DIU70_12325 [Bacillota bacterium]